MNDPFKNEFQEQMRRMREHIQRNVRERVHANIHDRMYCYSCKSDNHGTLVSGLVIVLVGLALLAAQMGFLSMNLVWHLWPMIFLAIGLGKLFGGRGANWVSSIFMLVLGALLLAHEFGQSNYGFVQLWPLLIVSAGAELFWQAWNNPRPSLDDDGTPTSTASVINTTNIFGGSENHIASKEFRGGQIVAIFGGFELDLTRADLAGDSARIEATAVFGGGEIRVPPTWNVVVRGAGVFGGYSDETHQIPAEPGKPVKTLFVEGAAVFGGVVVKN